MPTFFLFWANPESSTSPKWTAAMYILMSSKTAIRSVEAYESIAQYAISIVSHWTKMETNRRGVVGELQETQGKQLKI